MELIPCNACKYVLTYRNIKIGFGDELIDDNAE